MQFETLFHYGFRNILGDLPFRHQKLFSLAQEVFDLCREPHIIHDLSLPDIDLHPHFSEVLGLISIKFVLKPSREVPVSCTFPPSAQTRDIKIDIFYSAKEMDYCPQCIESRVSHELSHAIRAGIVSLANRNLASQGFAPKYHIRTPVKAPSDRITPHTGQLYKLEGADFHSGYLVEHILYGGIIVQLIGSYFFQPGTNETPIVNSVTSDDNMFVKIVSRDPKVWGYRDVNNDLVDYDRLVCYVFDGSSFGSGLGMPTTLFHFGSRITRSQ